MDGCTLQTTGLPRGTFLGLVLKPDQEDEAIRIETAMVCSVRPTSVGLRFEIPLPDQRRLSQVVLGLLVSKAAIRSPTLSLTSRETFSLNSKTDVPQHRTSPFNTNMVQSVSRKALPMALTMYSSHARCR